MKNVGSELWQVVRFGFMECEIEYFIHEADANEAAKTLRDLFEGKVVVELAKLDAYESVAEYMQSQLPWLTNAIP